MKKSLLGVLLLIICMFLPVAAMAADTPGVTKDEITIGMTCPMSGPAALWSAMALGNSAWAKYINDQGGINGRKIKFVAKDDGYNPSRALGNLTEMKNDVFAFVSVIGSATSNASKDFLVTSKVPVVYVHANPRMWVNVPAAERRHIFIAYPDYFDEAEAITNYAVTKLGIKSLALFGQNDDWGKSAEIGIQKAMKTLGDKGKFSGFVTFEMTDRAVGGHALKLKELGADAVVIYGAPTQAALIIKEMIKIGYKPKIFTANPLGDPLMYKIAGDSWEGAYPATAANVSIPGVEPEADRVVEILLKYEPTLKGREFLGVVGSTSMMLAVEALKKAGPDLTRENFIKAMESIKNLKLEGMGAPITFSASQRHGLNGIRICEAKNGKHVPISDFMIFKPLF